MRRNFFVDPAPCRSNLLQMEVRLAYILKDDIGDCVLNEDAVKQYVENLKAVQDTISRENPKLRRVEISTDIDSRSWYPGQVRFISVGQYNCPLREVHKIV